MDTEPYIKAQNPVQSYMVNTVLQADYWQYVCLLLLSFRLAYYSEDYLTDRGRFETRLSVLSYEGMLLIYIMKKSLVLMCRRLWCCEVSDVVQMLGASPYPAPSQACKEMCWGITQKPTILYFLTQQLVSLWQCLHVCVSVVVYFSKQKMSCSTHFCMDVHLFKYDFFFF